MTPRYVSKNLVGAAALLAFGASIAFAQDTTKTNPRSQRRIPISKDATGEVGRTRVDTVTQTLYKTDTLRMNMPGHTDTVRVAGPSMTTVVHDTVMAQPMMKPMRLPGGFYFGVAGGVSAPNKAIYIPNSAGPSAQAQLGWQGRDNPLGLRIDANYAQPGDDSQYAQYQGNPSIVNLNGDVKLGLPFLTHMMGAGPRFGLYVIGGASYVMYKDLPIRLNPGTPGGVGPVDVRVGPTNWEKNLGWNYGAGASLAWGNKELFFETRIIDFNTDNTPRVRQIPFMLGINLF